MQKIALVVFTLFCGFSVFADDFSCELKVGSFKKKETAEYHKPEVWVKLQGFDCVGFISDGVYSPRGVTVILYPLHGFNDDNSVRQTSPHGPTTATMADVSCTCGLE